MSNESKSWSFDFTSSPISISSIFGEIGKTLFLIFPSFFGVKWFSLLRDDDLDITLPLLPFEAIDFLNEFSFMSPFEFEGNLRLGDGDFRVVLVLGKWW